MCRVKENAYIGGEGSPYLGGNIYEEMSRLRRSLKGRWHVREKHRNPDLANTLTRGLRAEGDNCRIYE